jgi:hypothetical protein
MKMLGRNMLTASLPLLLSACSGGGGSSNSGGPSGASSPEGTALFSVSGSATPDQIFGVWGMPSANADSVRINGRTRFTADSVEAAAQCVDNATQAQVIADVTARARVSNKEVDVLEANTDVRTLTANGVTGHCNATTSVNSSAQCTPSALASLVPRSCFDLKGTTLTIYDELGVSEKWTKISD